MMLLCILCSLVFVVVGCCEVVSVLWVKRCDFLLFVLLSCFSVFLCFDVVFVVDVLVLYVLLCYLFVCGVRFVVICAYVVVLFFCSLSVVL